MIENNVSKLNIMLFLKVDLFWIFLPKNFIEDFLFLYYYLGPEQSDLAHKNFQTELKGKKLQREITIYNISLHLTRCSDGQLIIFCRIIQFFKYKIQLKLSGKKKN